MLAEGAVVSWVGSAHPGGVAVGDTGVVVSSSGACGHVQWSTGARVGQMDLIEEWDVVPVPTTTRVHTVSSSLSDSLGVDTVHTAARETFEDGGAAALLSVMHREGSLSCFAEIAEEALGFVATRLRNDAAFVHVLSALDESDAAAMVTLASSVLLRDAFTPMDPED